MKNKRIIDVLENLLVDVQVELEAALYSERKNDQEYWENFGRFSSFCWVRKKINEQIKRS